MQSSASIVAISAAILCGVSILADRRRLRRADLDRVGWVPWPSVTMLALLTALVAGALALKG